MILAVLIAGALALTYGMFHTRNGLLGFPASIFWFLLGGHAYTLFTTAWVDIEYYIFFASMFIGVFTMLSAYTLRKRELDQPDIGEGEMIDEKGEVVEVEEHKEEEFEDSLNKRAVKRKKGRRFFKE